jgi:hypothetical protein
MCFNLIYHHLKPKLVAAAKHHVLSLVVVCAGYRLLSLSSPSLESNTRSVPVLTWCVPYRQVHFFTG